jgi:SAM-dependent methyltransferase
VKKQDKLLSIGLVKGRKLLIKIVFFNLLLSVIFKFPSLLENSLVRRFIKVPFRHLVGKVDYDTKVAIDDKYKEPFKRGLNKYLELEQDQPREVLDLGTGTGAASIYFGENLNDARVQGVDISEGMLEKARKKAEKKELNNVEFTEGDIYDLPYENSTFDLITVSNAPFSPSEVKRALKEGGYFLISLSKGGGFLANREEKVRNKLLKYEFRLKAIESVNERGLFLLAKLE